MVLPNHAGIGFGQSIEHSFDEFLIFDATDFADVGSRQFQVGGMRLHVSERLGHATGDHFPDNDTACNHRQIRGERTFAPEPSENGHVIGKDRQEDFCTKIINVAFRQIDTSCLGGVTNDVDEKPGKAVDELTPRIAFTFQAAFEESTVMVGQRHIAPVGEADPKQLGGQSLK